MVILAHCEPPSWLYQLRNFDVPLLIVVSAMTYARIYQDKAIDIKKFYAKRISKLVIPAWIFLSVFFVIAFLYSASSHKTYPFTTEEILTSYSFYSGIGYVWILKVFLFVALVTPLLLGFKKRIANNNTYFLILGLALVLNEIVLWITHQIFPNQYILKPLHELIFILIPYGALYAYGLKLQDLKTVTILMITGISLAIFTLIAVYLYRDAGEIVGTIIAKYPPTVYYLSYALGMLNLTYLICKAISKISFGQNLVTWISANSLWIYLWHILTLYAFLMFFSEADKNLVKSLIQYLCVLAGAVGITFIQNHLVKMFLEKRSDRFSKTMTGLLTSN